MEEETFECLGCHKVWKKSEVIKEKTYVVCPKCGVFCQPLIPDKPATIKESKKKQ